MNDLSVKDYLTNLETDKEELVNNLNERGVDASTDETFTSLTKKVKTIGEGSMPYATEDIAGVIKVGKNLKMDNDGKLNASLDEFPTYEVTLVSDFINDTGSSGRGLNNNDRDALWDMYHWAEEISQVSDYCVTYTFKNQPCHGGAKTFKKYITYFYTKGTLPSEYLLTVCFGYSANGSIINGHAKSVGTICVANLYFRWDPNSYYASLSVSRDDTGEYLINTYALTKDNRGEYTPTGDYNPATKLYVDRKVNEVGIQFIEMPEASTEYVGKVLQYIGETTASYIKGHFYTCISDGAAEPAYQWTEISIGGGGGSSIPTITEDTYIRNLTGSIYKVQDDVKLYLAEEGKSTTYYLMPTENITNSYLLILKDETTSLFKFVLWAGRARGRFFTSDGTDNRGGIFSAGNIFYSQVFNTSGTDRVFMFSLNSSLGASVINDLTSTSTTSSLSANQGRILNERITNEIGNINTVLATLVDIEEGE